MSFWKGVQNTLHFVAAKVADFFGLSGLVNDVNNWKRDIREARHVREQVYSLAQQIINDMENKADYSTPSTFDHNQLKNYIADINRKYTQEAYEIQKAAEKLDADVNNWETSQSWSYCSSLRKGEEKETSTTNQTRHTKSSAYSRIHGETEQRQSFENN